MRPATDLDPALASELLRGVVAATFAGDGNHYSVNPLLEAELALDDYVEWALSCLGSPDCLVHVMTVEGQPRSRVVISTQVQNTRVQRAWARFGFEPVAAFETVHLVRRGLLPAPHQP